MTSHGLFTKHEIASQPEIWEKSIEHLQTYSIHEFPSLDSFNQIIFTGCGSTYYLAIWAARQCEQTTGVMSRAVPAGELLMFPHVWLHKKYHTLLIAISRSASTLETVRALQFFKANAYGEEIVVTCHPENILSQLSHHVISTPDAQEKSIAQTRSFSNMLLGLLYLIQREIPKDTSVKLRTAGEYLFSQYQNLSQEITKNPVINKFIFLGSGALYGLALEAMLKMKEMSLSHSEAFHFLEFRHGPISILDKHTLLVGLVGEESNKTMLNVLDEAKSIGAHILTLSDKPLLDIQSSIDHPIVFRSALPTPWYDPLYLPVLQMLAYQRATINHLDPDNPTNLTAVVEEI